jgi:hypothetical protein
MSALAFVIALLALIVALIALRRGGGAPPPVPRYTLKGTVELINDCDGLVASLPNRVQISSSLNDPQGQSIGGTVQVPVAPDPADPPGAPRVVGRYSISVAWPGALGNPVAWDGPRILRANGQRICEPILCPGAGLCGDRATRARQIAFVNPVTTEDLRVACACS